jgi:hypothetical protein
MKKIIPFWPVALFIFALTQCNPKEKKPGTVLVTPAADTTKIIDTTIIEDGVAPVISNDALAKKDKIDKEEKQKKIKIICSFGQNKFNTRKRPIEEAPGGVKGRKPKPQYPPTPPPDEPPTNPPTISGNVVFLQFFGDTVQNTMWNTNGTLIVGDAGLAQSEFDVIKTQVEAGLLNYNVQVTYDESVFNAAPIGHKIKVIVTEDYQWFGMAGGVAYINSWWWTDGSPAFVFSTLLNYNSHHIAEAIRHEASHTWGLRHQSDCVNGVVTNQYRFGWTMGNSYDVNVGIYGTGTSSVSCIEQDDVAKLTSAIGLKQIAYFIKPNHLFRLKHQSDLSTLKIN